jgi:hypothetical protein
VYLEPGARLVLEEDDDGSVLPPRRHDALEHEPTNAGSTLPSSSIDL